MQTHVEEGVLAAESERKSRTASRRHRTNVRTVRRHSVPLPARRCAARRSQLRTVCPCCFLCAALCAALFVGASFVSLFVRGFYLSAASGADHAASSSSTREERGSKGEGQGADERGGRRRLGRSGAELSAGMLPARRRNPVILEQFQKSCQPPPVASPADSLGCLLFFPLRQRSAVFPPSPPSSWLSFPRATTWVNSCCCWIRRMGVTKWLDWCNTQQRHSNGARKSQSNRRTPSRSAGSQCRQNRASAALVGALPRFSCAPRGVFHEADSTCSNSQTGAQMQKLTFAAHVAVLV
jgi:hypothetical protein